MIGHYLSSNNEICYSTKTQTFSPTKQSLNNLETWWIQPSDGERTIHAKSSKRCFCCQLQPDETESLKKPDELKVWRSEFKQKKIEEANVQFRCLTRSPRRDAPDRTNHSAACGRRWRRRAGDEEGAGQRGPHQEACGRGDSFPLLRWSWRRRLLICSPFAGKYKPRLFGWVPSFSIEPKHFVLHWFSCWFWTGVLPSKPDPYLRHRSMCRKRSVHLSWHHPYWCPVEVRPQFMIGKIGQRTLLKVGICYEPLKIHLFATTHCTTMLICRRTLNSIFYSD